MLERVAHEEQDFDLRVGQALSQFFKRIAAYQWIEDPLIGDQTTVWPRAFESAGDKLRKVRRTIVKHTLRMLEELNIVPLCEGVETVGEMSALRDVGVSLIQGDLLAKPSFEHLAIPASAKAMLAAAA